MMPREAETQTMKEDMETESSVDEEDQGAVAERTSGFVGSPESSYA